MLFLYLPPHLWSAALFSLSPGSEPLAQLELWCPGTAVLASGQAWRWRVCDTGWAAFFLGQQSGVGITRAGWTWDFQPGPGEPCFSGRHRSFLLPLQLCWGGGPSAGALICREAWFPSWFSPPSQGRWRWSLGPDLYFSSAGGGAGSPSL